MVDVSLVIVNWNTERYLIDCIGSMKNEAKDHTFEIIVVDNGSLDGSVERTRRTHPDVTIIENGMNLGFARANNIGIRASSGRFVCLVNTDVIVLDGTIDKLVSHLDAHPEIGAIAPMTVDGGGRIRENCRYFPTLRNIACETIYLHRLFPDSRRLRGRSIPRKYYKRLYEAENLSGCFLMVRREAMSEVGMLDERFFIYGEDIDWCKRYVDGGWAVVYLSSARSIHFGGGSSSSAPIRFQIEMEKANLQYWKKHRGTLAVFVYRVLMVMNHGLSVIATSIVVILTRNDGLRQQRRGKIGRLTWILFGRSGLDTKE